MVFCFWVFFLFFLMTKFSVQKAFFSGFKVHIWFYQWLCNVKTHCRKYYCRTILLCSLLGFSLKATLSWKPWVQLQTGPESAFPGEPKVGCEDAVWGWSCGRCWMLADARSGSISSGQSCSFRTLGCVLRSRPVDDHTLSSELNLTES